MKLVIWCGGDIHDCERIEDIINRDVVIVTNLVFDGLECIFKDRSDIADDRVECFQSLRDALRGFLNVPWRRPVQGSETEFRMGFVDRVSIRPAACERRY